jgi:hypothetical protein
MDANSHAYKRGGLFATPAYPLNALEIVCCQVLDSMRAGENTTRAVRVGGNPRNLWVS